MLTPLQLVFGSESTAFRCTGCGARLAKTTYAFPVMLGLGIPLWFFGRLYVGNLVGLIFLACLLPATFIVGLLTTKVRFAGEDVPDAPKVEVPKTAPRPEITPFRGSKTPPPMYHKAREPDAPTAKVDD